MSVSTFASGAWDLIGVGCGFLCLAFSAACLWGTVKIVRGIAVEIEKAIDEHNERQER